MNNPRDTAMNQPPEESSFPAYLDPSAEPTFMTIESTAELIEHEMVRTLLDVMVNAKRDVDKLSAVKESGDLLGMKQKSNINLISADNVQVNQLTADPKMQKALMEAGKGLASVATARDSGVRSKFSGTGV